MSSLNEEGMWLREVFLDTAVIFWCAMDVVAFCSELFQDFKLAYVA